MKATSRGQLFTNIQALRAIAALLVVLSHIGVPDVGGDVLAMTAEPLLGPVKYFGAFGVDLFFVISGFIMLATSWKSFGKPDASREFFLRRIIRIYPPYWFAMLPVLPVMLYASSRFMTHHVGVKTDILRSLLLLPNPSHFVINVAWTLVWEMLFYVVFAALLLFDRKRFLPAAAIWFLMQVVLYVVWFGSTNFYLHFFATPLPIEFIAGAVIGWLCMNGKLPPALPVLAAGCLLCIVAWTWDAAHAIEITDNARVVVFGIPAAIIVCGAVALEVQHGKRAPKWLVTLGDASYAMYLWHLSVIVVARSLILRFHPVGLFWDVTALLLTLAAVIVSALIVFRFFERPVTSYLNAITKSKALAPRATSLGQVSTLSAKTRES